MGFMDIFRRKTPDAETRSSGSGYTAQVIQARDAFITGRTGVAELTATVQGAVSLWEGAMAAADVSGTDMLSRRHMALSARAMALRGEAVFYIGDDRLIPASDWDITTRDGVPRAYRLSLPEVGGGRTQTALAAEVLHFAIGADVAQPWFGTSPLRRSSLSADLLYQVETALRDVYRDAPMGSLIVPLPDSNPEDMQRMRDGFKGRRGSTLVVEGVAQSTAAGMNPQLGKSPDQLSPDLSKAMTRETLAAARDAVNMAFGILPGLANPATTGPMVREAQRHLATWALQPIAMTMAEEITDKLGQDVTIDVMRPLQAFDAGGRARALSGIVKALSEAKAAGIDPDKALSLVGWSEE